MNEIMQYISTIGFPIVMCLLMFKQVNELREVIQNNTIVLQKLVQKIGGDEDSRTDK